MRSDNASMVDRRAKQADCVGEPDKQPHPLSATLVHGRDDQSKAPTRKGFMPTLRLITLVSGVVVLLAGLLFLGQGTDVFPYPKTSFMVAQTPWACRGVYLIVLGAALVVLSRAFRGR